MAGQLADQFIIWEPRDIVGGDLYWLRQERKGCMIVLLDCTGHGVPGALMTTIAVSALDHGFQETSDPARMIAQVNRSVKAALRQNSDHTARKNSDDGLSDDGLELGICLVEPERHRLTFAGARFPLLVLEGDEVKVISGDKSGVGYRHIDADRRFTNHMLTLRPGMKFYMYSDGVTDQIGGAKHRAFGRKRIVESLIENRHLSMTKQRAALLNTFRDYQGDEERRDDVAMIGFMPLIKD